MSRDRFEQDARSRVVDALLRQHLGETPLGMEARYTRAFAGLDADTAARGRANARMHAFRWARAALIAACAGVLMILVPAESRAAGDLARAMSNEARTHATGGERRYAVEVLTARDGWLRGQWDMRGAESRLEIALDGMPSRLRVDSSEGAWERNPEGLIRDLEERQLWPRWIEGADGSIAVERMDSLLHLVQHAYEVVFARAGNESPAELRGSLHIVAARREHEYRLKRRAALKDDFLRAIEVRARASMRALAAADAPLRCCSMRSSWRR
jgi:hypothetical protein